MNQVTANLRLDTFRENNIPVLKIPQGDYNARYVKATIMSQGIPLVISDGVTVTIIAERSTDGASNSFSGSRNDDGTVSVPITKWMLAYEGDVYCSISISGISGDSTYKYSTTQFLIEVQHHPESDGSSGDDSDDGMSGTDYTVLLEMINDLTARVKKLEDAVDKLNYTKIAITSFNSSPSVAEIGSTVNNPILSWSITKEARAISIDGAEITPPSETMYLASGSFTANKTWTLSVEESDTATVVTKTTTLSFMNGVYWGVHVDEDYDSDTILSLGYKELRNAHVSSFSATPDAMEYIFYCVPVRFGTCRFKIGGFEGGFEEPKIVSFTNASGYTEDYYVYRSTNYNLGETTVEVIRNG